MSPAAADDLKRRAAAQALTHVTEGMRLGLGTGSTAKHFVDLLGERVKAGLNVLCVPTSEATRAQAQALGVPLTTLDETPELDLTIDGADEFDASLRLVKGGGGALLREKIVAAASARMIVITDDSKRVATLGRFPLPVEIVPFGAEATRRAMARAIQRAGCAGDIVLRRGGDGHVFVTDGGHFIFDCRLGSIADPEKLAALLAGIPGVVETGLFLNLADAVIVAAPGGVEVVGDPTGAARQNSRR
ncbi:MAG: ribose-5-phosphate isomerase RpiA [Hyphomicrobiales bacterium]|nr:ribose-5-phosphate isomerase RpiA [Hyphomicrobiales bacterium]